MIQDDCILMKISRGRSVFRKVTSDVDGKILPKAQIGVGVGVSERGFVHGDVVDPARAEAWHRGFIGR